MTFAINGSLVRRLRENAGYTVRGFAAEVGISFAHLSAIERGVKQAGPPTAKKIADGLGVTVQEIRT